MTTIVKKIQKVTYSEPKRIYHRGKRENIQYGLVEGDYAGFQLRIIAGQTDDQQMYKAFTELGGDLHSMTAVNVFHAFDGLKLEDFIKHKGENPYKHERKLGKSINFGLCFGMGASTFAKRNLRDTWMEEQALNFCKDNKVKLTEKYKDPYIASASVMRDRYFQTYPTLVPWHDKMKAMGRKQGYIYSPTGARRLVPQLMYIGKDDDGSVLSNLDSVCINTNIQNIEVVCISRSMRKCWKLLKEGDEYNNYHPYTTFIFAMIHDAVSYYMDKNPYEKNHLIQEFHKLYEYPYRILRGIPTEYEIEFASPDDPVNPAPWGFGDVV